MSSVRCSPERMGRVVCRVCCATHVYCVAQRHPSVQMPRQKGHAGATEWVGGLCRWGGVCGAVPATKRKVRGNGVCGAGKSTTQQNRSEEGMVMAGQRQVVRVWHKVGSGATNGKEGGKGNVACVQTAQTRGTRACVTTRVAPRVTNRPCGKCVVCALRPV